MGFPRRVRHRIRKLFWSLVHASLATLRERGNTRVCVSMCSTRDYDAVVDCREDFVTSQDEENLETDLEAVRDVLEYDPGLSPIDDLLSKLHPLNLLQHEMDVRTKLFGLCLDTISMEEAFITAVNLERELKMKTKPDHKMTGGYVTEHMTKSEMPIVFDTGASLSVTPVRCDFIAEPEKTDVENMTGLSDSVLVKGVGWVEWTVRDVFRRIHRIRTRAYWVPTASI